MHWIRKNRRFGSWAAVFALTIQLVLSFGHIHPEDFQGSPTLTASSSQANPALPMMTTAGAALISAPFARRSI